MTQILTCDPCQNVVKYYCQNIIIQDIYLPCVKNMHIKRRLLNKLFVRLNEIVENENWE